MSRPRTPNAAPEDVALLVAVRDPSRISGISRTMPTAVPTAIAEIVAHRPSPKVIPTQPKATAPRPTEPPMKMTKNVVGVEVRSRSGMRSTPLRSKPEGSKPARSARSGPGRFGTAVPAAPDGACLVLRQPCRVYTHCSRPPRLGPAARYWGDRVMVGETLGRARHVP